MPIKCNNDTTSNGSDSDSDDDDYETKELTFQKISCTITCTFIYR